MSQEITFLGFMVNPSRLKSQAKSTKIKAITNLYIPKPFIDIRGIHGQAIFYKSFITRFRTIVNQLEKDKFKCTYNAQEAFDQIKILIITSLPLRLPNGSKGVEVANDAFEISIGGVLSQ